MSKIKNAAMATKHLLFIFIVIQAFFYFAPLCFAVERITDDFSASMDLIDAQNFGSLNLETSQVNINATSDASSIAGKTTATVENILKGRIVSDSSDVSLFTSGAPATAEASLNNAPKSEEIDLISKLIPDETYEVIGSSAAISPVAEEHFKIGTDLFNQKIYIESKAHFEKAVRLEPNNDVYLLALDMVNNTMRAQGIKEPLKMPEALLPSEKAAQQVSNDSKNQVSSKPDRPEADKKNIQANKNKQAPETQKTKPLVKTQVFTCNFEERLPVGNIIFNTGINTDIKKSDIDGYYVNFDAEEEALALAAFRLDCEPKKAILIVNQKLFADENNFSFPLTIKANNAEILNGAFRLAMEFRPYQFDITGKLHRGFNQILFQTAPTKTSNLGLLRIEIFIQNY